MGTRASASLVDLGIRKVDEAAGIVEYRMKNGLKILLRENHSAPVVSFMVVYRVGSRNEAVGYTGSTHFLEHMMFKGTRKFNPASGSGVMETFSRIGALLNATTWLDRTNYFECVPKEYLELCIEVEADRMRNLNLRQEDRDSEMTVVRNEFERGENSPSSALSKELHALAFREHPYHHPTIGWRSDVEGVPLSRLREFYDTFYWPNNATVIVVGDIEQDATLKLLSKYFGKIAKSPHDIPLVYTQEPPQEGERRLELCRAGDLPQLMLAYHTPEAAHKDTHALSVMHAVLGDSGKRSSRLYRALLETGLATSCYASNGEFRDPHLFSLGATVSPGHSFAELEAVIYAEIEKLAKEPVEAEELTRAKAANRKGTILGSADPQTFANMLCMAESVDTWKWLVEYDDHFDRVSPADLMRVASTYFDPSNRTVAHFIPTSNGKQGPNLAVPETADATKKTRAAKKNPAAKKPVQKRLELPSPDSKGSNFSQRVYKEVLPNGLTVLVLPNPGTGSVAIHGAIPAGDCLAEYELSCIPALSSSMLNRGSLNFSKVDLAKAFEEMGIRFGFAADRYRVAFGTLVTKEDFASFVPLLADMLINPRFAEDELQLLLKEMRAALTRSINETSRRANNALMQSLYPRGHAFYEKDFGERLEELDKISPDLLASFHARNYTARDSVLAVVGDIEVRQAMALVKEHLSEWRAGQGKFIKSSVPGLALEPRRIEVNLEDKASVDVLIGQWTELSRQNPDFFAAQLANAALGKDTISARLGKELRVKHGLTYGIYSYFDDSSFGSAPWLIGFSVNPANLSKALKLTDDVLRQYLKSGISKQELEDEAGRAVGSFLVSLRSSEGIASVLARLEYIGLGVSALDSLADDYMSVSRKAANDALRRYLDPDKTTTVIAGTLSKIV